MTLQSLLYDKEPTSTVFWDEISDWWKSLSTNRGVRARLRRAKTPTEVFVSSDYQRGLLASMQSKGIVIGHTEALKLACAVGVLAHVKDLLFTGHFARQLAPSEQNQESVRDPRFRKLIATTDPEDLFLMLRRLVGYLDGKAELKSLVRGASDWTNKTRRNWAIQYYVNRSAKQ